MSCAWLDTDCGFQATVMLLADELVAEIGEVRADLATEWSKRVPKPPGGTFTQLLPQIATLPSNLDCQAHTFRCVSTIPC